MSKILAKVQQLIALANSSHSEEECRTSAMMAVKLIQKHHLALITTWETPEDAPPPPPPRQPPPQEEEETGDASEYSHLYKSTWKWGDPLRGRAELKELAKEKVHRLFFYFRRMAKNGKYPFKSLPQLVKQEVTGFRLHPDEKATFSYYLSMELHTERVCGRLDSIPSKGYCLATKKRKKT